MTKILTQPGQEGQYRQQFRCRTSEKMEYRGTKFHSSKGNDAVSLLLQTACSLNLVRKETTPSALCRALFSFLFVSCSSSYPYEKREL